MSRIYWDTHLFIYWLEDRAESARVGAIFRAMQERGDQLCSSIFTLAELLVRPYQKKALDAAERARAALRPPRVMLIGFDERTADFYARIRAGNRVKPPDAIHLASAASAGVNLFLTNDRSLLRLRVPGIDFIAPIDTDLF
ncbi:MAG: type II toxin-antitoxin system VapC family toxin [Terriglobales bacterium]